MLSDKASAALIDIRHNIVLAQGFLAGITFDQFKESDLYFYAVTRALEIISEASRRLPDEVRDRHPGLPWRAIRDAGNMYRHGYDVALSYVWKTARDDLAPLLAAVTVEIDMLDSAP